MYEPEELFNKFWWLTAPQAAIRRRLKLTDKVSIKKLRYNETWHVFPIAANWAATVGSWGGVCTIHEIQAFAGVNYEAFNKFKQRNHLGAARNVEARVPGWKVALTAAKSYDDNFKMEEVDRIVSVAANAGILPFELMLYVHEVGELKKRFKVKDALDLLNNDTKRDLVELAWCGTGGVADVIDMATPGIYTEPSR